jgi:membrane-associated phospholipid phosphatase
LTNFGDTAVLLPLSLVFFLWLLATHRTATAVIWLLIVFACNFVIGALKLYFLSCPAGGILHSPSGHTGFAILVYGSITLVLAAAVRRRWLRGLIIALGTALVVAIAVSRLVLGNHSPLEILIGAGVGGLSLAGFATLYRRGANRPGLALLLAVTAVIVAVNFHGEQLRAENFLRHLATQLGLRGDACPYR